MRMVWRHSKKDNIWLNWSEKENKERTKENFWGGKMVGKFEGHWGKCLGKKFYLFDLEMRTEKEKEKNSWEENFLVQEYEGKRQIFGSKNRRGRRTKKVNRNFIRYQNLLSIIYLVYFPCHSLRGNIYFLIHIFRNYLSGEQFTSFSLFLRDK